MAAKDNTNEDHEKEENLRALEEKVKGNPCTPKQINTLNLRYPKPLKHLNPKAIQSRIIPIGIP
jgi:hypothetical protein